MSGEEHKGSGGCAESPGEVEYAERRSARVFAGESYGHVCRREHESESNAVKKHCQRSELPGGETGGGESHGDELKSSNDAEARSPQGDRCGEGSAGELRRDQASEFCFGDVELQAEEWERGTE